MLSLLVYDTGLITMTPPFPPIPPKKPFHIQQFGHKRTDDYAWMKDKNWQKVLSDPNYLKKDIADYLKQENEYTEQILQTVSPLQSQLFEEMKARLSPYDSFPLLEDGPWLYGSRFEQGNQYPLYIRQSQENGKEEILLDINARSNQFEYYQLGQVQHSPDHTLLAYGEDLQGSEIWQISIKDLTTSEILPQYISDCTGNFTFSADSEYLFWVYRDAHGRPTQIFRRHIKSAEDTVIYHEKDPGFFLSIERSLSNQWILITAKDHDTSEVWLISATQPTNHPVCMTKRKKGLQYEVLDWNDHFIIRTNLDNAYNFKLMQVKIPQNDIITQKEELIGFNQWQEWITHNPANYIVECIAYQDYFVRLERHNVNTRIIFTDKNGKNHSISEKEEAFTLSLDSVLTANTSWLRYIYQSPTTPRQWWHYNMETGEKILLKTQQIPTGHMSSDYCTKRLWAKASDGENIPITVTYHKDTPLDGSAPLLLYGYGSYGYAIDPIFSIINLNYLNRGWVYAIAHIRGGSEKGWNWFLQGRHFKKINSFTDFICCAEYLIDQHFTNSGRIIADGRSAGGMVMGAIANMRPDLFAGIIAVVPFVDVLNTMSDNSLPLTPPEWPEWGNPLQDETAYTYISNYSPYDNITPKNYPSILAVGGLSDPRVTYWEPAKWVAKLRDHNLSKNPILLKINMEAGHAGATGRFDALKEAAFIQSFAFWVIESMDSNHS